jgi:hypothetical protein
MVLCALTALLIQQSQPDFASNWEISFLERAIRVANSLSHSDALPDHFVSEWTSRNPASNDHSNSSIVTISRRHAAVQFCKVSLRLLSYRQDSVKFDPRRAEVSFQEGLDKVLEFFRQFGYVKPLNHDSLLSSTRVGKVSPGQTHFYLLHPMRDRIPLLNIEHRASVRSDGQLSVSRLDWSEQPTLGSYTGGIDEVQAVETAWQAFRWRGTIANGRVARARLGWQIPNYQYSDLNATQQAAADRQLSVPMWIVQIGNADGYWRDKPAEPQHFMEIGIDPASGRVMGLSEGDMTVYSAMASGRLDLLNYPCNVQVEVGTHTVNLGPGESTSASPEFPAILLGNGDSRVLARWNSKGKTLYMPVRGGFIAHKIKPSESIFLDRVQTPLDLHLKGTGR